MTKSPKFLNECNSSCLPPYPSRSLRASPLDHFGFRDTCCKCVPLRPAAAIICFLTFMWAVLEMCSAHKFLGKAIEDKVALYWCKMVFFVITVGLMVTSGVLLLGILLKKYSFVNFYMWYVLTYGVVTMLVYIAVAATVIARTGKCTLRLGVKLAFTVVWYSLMYYFLIIVNSFKLTL